MLIELEEVSPERFPENFPYLDARTQNVSNVATGALAFKTNGYYIFLEYYQNNSQLQ